MASQKYTILYGRLSQEDELCKIVLDDLQRVTHFARMKERQFAAYINQKNSKELRQEMNTLQKDLDAMRKRDGELSTLFKRLYEDHVLQRITAEQFRMLSADYNTEQKALQEAIPEKEDRLEKLKASAANVEVFIEKAKRFTTIDKLTPELVRLFIQRIEIERVPGFLYAFSAPLTARIPRLIFQRNLQNQGVSKMARIKMKKSITRSETFQDFLMAKKVAGVSEKTLLTYGQLP